MGGATSAHSVARKLSYHTLAVAASDAHSLRRAKLWQNHRDFSL
jgi:hypothetical protein